MVIEAILRKEIKKIPRPFGIFLSGGIDSGLLAALSKPDFAVTCDTGELKYAQKIAKHLGIPLDVVTLSKVTYKGFLNDAIKIIGKPTTHFSLVPWYCLMGHSQGETMINGEGSDELFGGYSRYLIMKHVFDLYKVPELKSYHPTLDFLFSDIHTKLTGTKLPFFKDIDIVAMSEFLKTLPPLIRIEKKLAKYFDIKLYQPFMSESVREYAWDLPLRAKIRGFQTKVILRHTAEKYLPYKVVYRKDKMGLVCPVNEWMGWKVSKYDKSKYIEYQNARLK